MEKKTKNFSDMLRSIPITYMMISSYGILVVMIILLISAIFYHNAKNIAIDTAENSHYKLLNETVSQLDILTDTVTELSFFGSNNVDLKLLLKNFPEDSALQEISYQYKIRDLVTQYWMIKPEIIGISIYTDKVKSVSSGTISVSSADYAREHGWIDALGDKRGIILSGENVYSRGNYGTPFSILSLVKILDDRNHVLGYLSFELSESFIYSSYLHRNKASLNSDIFIINQEGKIISHKDKALLGQFFQEVYPAISHPKNGPFQLNGQETLMLVSQPNNMGWQAVELIPVNEIYLGRESVLISLISAALVALLVAFPLTWLISAFISRPIVKLSAIMSEETPLKVSQKEGYRRWKNEIGALYRDYYHMIERINLLIDQVKYSMNTMRRAEISALQAQINPHFMYNTLDYINWMSQDSNMPDISRMLTHLSRFLRFSLSDSCAVCTLKNELEHVTAYLEIFKVRYGNRFSYSVCADPSLLEYFIPKFILQPLVENSIIHGFHRNMEGALIEILVERGNDCLSFHVCDNGNGMSDEQLQKALNGRDSDEERKHGGYGIKNVNDRIQFVCGSRFSGLILMDSGRGTHLYFELPLRDQADRFEV